MARDEAYRKYQLTINNPIEKGFSHESLKNIIGTFKGCIYWCMSDEIGAQETPHTHVYIAFKNAVEFKSIQERFYGAHIEKARGTHRENRDYIRKEGKWLADVKHGTRIEGTFEESGDLPEEVSAQQKQSEHVLEMIKTGATDIDIINEHPSQMNHIKNIDATRQMLLEDEYKSTFRELNVFYIWGKSGVGKTRSVMEQYGYENVFRITDYKHPFDSYKGQSVILFDEFRSSLPITDMLNYLDGYPLELPCRYSNKIACFTKVYLISNIPLDKQYPNVQTEEPETFNAFKRRINGGAYERIDDAALDF